MFLIIHIMARIVVEFIYLIH